MDQHSFETTTLGRPSSYVGGLVHVRLSPEVVVTFDRITIGNIAHLFPTGLLRLHRDGKGRQYVELRGREGAQERYPVARIILALHRVTDPQNRQAHYRDGNHYNLRPENLYLGEAGYLSGSDAAWQEVERRKAVRAVDSNPDVTAAEIIGGTPKPLHNSVRDAGTPPVRPSDRAAPSGISDGAAGGDDDDS